MRKSLFWSCLISSILLSHWREYWREWRITARDLRNDVFMLFSALDQSSFFPNVLGCFRSEVLYVRSIWYFVSLISLKHRLNDGADINSNPGPDACFIPPLVCVSAAGTIDNFKPRHVFVWTSCLPRSPQIQLVKSQLVHWLSKWEYRSRTWFGDPQMWYDCNTRSAKREITDCR